MVCCDQWTFQGGISAINALRCAGLLQSMDILGRLCCDQPTSVREFADINGN
ncbi:hypothetical protein DPMN_187032 [Dreissena polymorpha]|uniref:Uncharacterized protein n=1 Tax=Dreissena polymorpha TaxID=45954 RepID=A0A9D4DPR9_DREPO|nr:hypothetical protein DPMN_187032 [Dreissena polymorpha]